RCFDYAFEAQSLGYSRIPASLDLRVSNYQRIRAFSLARMLEAIALGQVERIVAPSDGVWLLLKQNVCPPPS
ncbi:MAG: hypothetical protein ACKN9E_16965, partial [Microcystaceae cyanobacterium]